MARKKATTPEDVDNMTDEQLDAELAAMREEQPEVTEDAETPHEPEVQAKADPDDGEQQEPDKAEEESAAEAKADDDDSDDDTPDTDKVDFKRFDHERRRRKDAETASKAAEERWQKRFDDLLAAQQATQAKADPKVEAEEEKKPVSFVQDPVGWGETAEQRIARLEQSLQERDSRDEAGNQERQIRDWVSHQEQQFAAQQTDYQDALNFLFTSKMTELAPAIPDEMSRQEYIRQEAKNYMMSAAQSQTSPAKMFYEMAKARGYQKPEPTPEPAKAETPQIDHGAAQAKAKTLSNSGGSPGVAAEPTGQQLLDMSDAEYDAYIASKGSFTAALAAV